MRSGSSPAETGKVCVNVSTADSETQGLRESELGLDSRLATPLPGRGHCEWTNALTIVVAIRFLAQNKFGLKQTAETDGAHTDGI